jgi:His/Glu/Gln/Arg/opine family amino acid ABC transporter permease subunit
LTNRFAASALVCLIISSGLSADTLDDIRQRGVLRWAGDQEGGAPYIISSDDPKRPTGFEAEIVEALAKRLGVRPEFNQCQWDRLGDLLRSGGTDIIINGIELRPDRLKTNICTIPYYVNELQLLARKDDNRLNGWADLKNKPGGAKWRIGVLTDTAAEKYLQEKFADEVEVRSFDGTTQAMDHVRDRQLDATLTDLIAANTYRDRYPTLKYVGETVGRGHFVIYLRQGDERLRDEINSSLRDMMQLVTIYDKYKIWNDAQSTLAKSESVEIQTETPERKRGLDVIVEKLPILLRSAWVTVKLSVISMPLAIVAGLLIAIGRLYGPAVLRWPLGLYVEVIRGTPLMLQLFVIFYVFPSIVTMPDSLREYFPWFAAIVGLAINYSAYEAEIYRAGLLAIPSGQLEAALALGMTRIQALRHVIVPQAVRMVIPPVTNDFIALFKDTSICSAVTLIELSKSYSIEANNSGAPLEIAAATAVLYLLMSYPLALVARRLEKNRKQVNV